MTLHNVHSTTVPVLEKNWNSILCSAFHYSTRSQNPPQISKTDAQMNPMSVFDTSITIFFKDFIFRRLLLSFSETLNSSSSRRPAAYQFARQAPVTWTATQHRGVAKYEVLASRSVWRGKDSFFHVHIFETPSPAQLKVFGIQYWCVSTFEIRTCQHIKGGVQL